MIKGIRWLFVVLFLASSVWVESNLNAKHRQKRPAQNAFFLQPLREGRYLPPIPIRMPPHFQKGSESTSKTSGDRMQSPWIPLQTSEEVSGQNVYVPPIRPPAVIATRKPPKTTFDIPLTKSIQVLPARPNMQTTGYIRKNLVQVHATRTTTEHPRQKMLGALAESTVQTLLNFTPVDEDWRPKSIPTTAAPKPNFAKNLGSKVDKHLNYTGVRFGKVNTVLKSRPQNGEAVKLSKNETNFVMRFTPEDIKFTSVEVKTEKIDTPFSVDSPEVQHLTGGFDERRSFFDGFSNPHKTAADWRTEGNLPYQGHKTSMENVPSAKKDPLNTESNDSDDERKTIFNVFPHTKKKNKMRLPGQEPFKNIPFSPESAPLTVRNKNTDQRDRTFVSKGFDSPNIKNEDIKKQISNDNRNFYSPAPNVYGTGSQQQVKSNLPYQGHATQPPVATNADYNNKNSVPNREPQASFSPNKPAMKHGEGARDEHPNDPKSIPNVPFISSPQHIPTNYSANAQLYNYKDPEISSHSDTSQYDSVQNSFPTDKTVEKGALTVVKVPLTTGIRYGKIISPGRTTIGGITKNSHDQSDPSERHFLRLSSIKYVPVSHEDISNGGKNNDFAVEGQLSGKPEEPKLKEVELKNPPKYLQFPDEEFLKPVIPLNYDKDADKSLGVLTFPYVQKTAEVISQNPDTSGDKGKAYVSASKEDYHENSKFVEKKPPEETVDSTYFQPVFSETSARKIPDTSRQIFQNDDTNRSAKKDAVKESSKPAFYEKVGENYLGTLQKISKDVIITKDTHFSPKDARRNGGQRGDYPRVVTPPPVITTGYDSSELHDDQGRREGVSNRTENYAIQHKPAFTPETSGRPRKPRITLSTGMLAGILVAALVFLGFLTGSMVYAFHQWKFGRSRSDRQKKKNVRSPGFPPEYLDENLAGNTYIHNNIFLPTPQNLEDRSPSDPDNNSVIEDEDQQPAASTRGRRHRRITELGAARREF